MKSILPIVVMQAVLQEAGTPAGGAVEAVKPEVPPMASVSSDQKDFSYHFKKEKIKNADGTVIGEGKKLPSVKVSLPVPNAQGLLEIVSHGGKELGLVLDLMAEAVFDQGRTLVNEFRAKNADAEIKPETFAQWAAQLTFPFIASIPRGERKGLGISEDDWKDFGADYVAVMPAVTGKDLDRINKHVQLFQKKFYPCRNDKKALTVLHEMLLLWAVNTSSMEDNETVYNYLKERVETLLKEEEKVLAEAL